MKSASSKGAVGESLPADLAGRRHVGTAVAAGLLVVHQRGSVANGESHPSIHEVVMSAPVPAEPWTDQ